MNKRDSILVLLFLLLFPAYYFASHRNNKAVEPGLVDALNDTPIVNVSRGRPVEAVPGMPKGGDFRDAVRNDAVGNPPGIIEDHRPKQLPPFEKPSDLKESPVTRESFETREVSPSAPQ